MPLSWKRLCTDRDDSRGGGACETTGKESTGVATELSGKNSSLGVESVVSFEVSAKGEPHSGVEKNKNEHE